jgi:zinc protease
MTHRIVQKACAGLLLISLAFTTLAAHSAINLADPIPVDPQIKVGKLANGLTYYIKKNGKPEKRVELRLVVKAGSILEDDDQQGLAHFTEHMAFNGTKHFKKNELISYLQSIGVGFGADLNAYTSFDETVYILPIPTDKKENLEKGFLVLEDWAHGVQMKDEDIDAERSIVLEEARARKGATDRVMKALLPAMFNGSRYADRLPIGKEEIIKSFKPEAIKRFYTDWYRPNLMAVVVVGDIEPAQAEAMIKAHFEKLKNPKNERERVVTKLTNSGASRALVITDSEVPNNAISISFPPQTARPEKIIADVRASRVRGLILRMYSERMSDLTQQSNPPFIRGNASYGRFVADYESFGMTATLNREGAEAAINALLAEHTRARQFGFTEQELERAKKNFLRSRENDFNERDKLNSASFASEYIRNFLQGEAIPGIANEYAYAQELIPTITLAEINQAAREILPSNGNKLTAYIGSSKDASSIPTEKQLLDFVAAAESKQVTAHTEKAIATSLMTKLPKAGSIVAESSDKALGLTYLTLSNGVKVILKPSDFKNDQVVFSARRFGGQFLYGDEDAINARFATAVVSSMGLADFSPVELSKIRAGKSANASAYFGRFDEGFSGGSGSADIELMLQMLTLRITNPRIDESLFESFVSRGQDSVKNTRANPNALFTEFYVDTLYNKHPRMHVILDPEDYKAINLKRSMEIYRARLSSAKGLTFIFAGSFEVEKIKPLLATYLASLPTADIPTMYKDLGIRPIKGVVKKEFNAGKEQKSRVRIAFTGEVNYSQTERELIDVAVAVLNAKVTEIIREKLGLIYSGSVSLELITRVPYGHYAIEINLPCAPENVDKVIAALFAEIDKMKTEGVKAEDLDKVKQNYMQAFKRHLKANQKWVSHLEEMVTDGIAPDSIITYEERLKAMTPEQMTEKIKQYFNMQNYVQLIHNPDKTSN